MTTAEAATRLGVSQRQIQRLIASGALTGTRRVGRAWLLDASSVVMPGHDRRRGRPWSGAVAWAALWRLSGLETPWVDPQTSRRLDERLARTDGEQLAYVCRVRARATRFRSSLSYMDTLRGRLRPTGASALDPARDLMSPPADRFDGYATGPEADAVVRDCHLVADPLGNVTIRIADHPVAAAWAGPMPMAVIGVDLMESTDPREAAAGRRLLEGLMP